MSSNALVNDCSLPLEATLLPAELLDHVAGGTIYYDYFKWIGYKLGVAERAYVEYVQQCGMDVFLMTS